MLNFLLALGAVITIAFVLRLISIYGVYYTLLRHEGVTYWKHIYQMLCSEGIGFLNLVMVMKELEVTRIWWGFRDVKIDEALPKIEELINLRTIILNRFRDEYKRTFGSYAHNYGVEWVLVACFIDEDSSLAPYFKTIPVEHRIQASELYVKIRNEETIRYNENQPIQLIMPFVNGPILQELMLGLGFATVPQAQLVEPYLKYVKD